MVVTTVHKCKATHDVTSSEELRRLRAFISCVNPFYGMFYTVNWVHVLNLDAVDTPILA
jgi:hypothetical protein